MRGKCREMCINMLTRWRADVMMWIERKRRKKQSGVEKKRERERGGGVSPRNMSLEDIRLVIPVIWIW